MTVLAFRNGHIETLHAGRSSELDRDQNLAKFKRVDLQTILRESSERMAGLFRLRDEDPQEFRRLIESHCATYARGWIRSSGVRMPAPHLPAVAGGESAPTLREQQARAIACYSFIDGFLAQWHRGEYSALLKDPAISRINDAGMASLMIDASERVAGCMALQWWSPRAYHSWVHTYQAHVDSWLADGPIVAVPKRFAGVASLSRQAATARQG